MSAEEDDVLDALLRTAAVLALIALVVLLSWAGAWLLSRRERRRNP